MEAKIRLAGFTIIELVLVLAIASILGTLGATGIAMMQRITDVDSTARQVLSVINQAQNKSATGAGQYGVYINTTLNPNRYILYKGTSYASRQTAYDKTFIFPKTVRFCSVNLGGAIQVNYSTTTGRPSASGNLVVCNKNDTSRIATVYVPYLGTASLAPTSVASDSARVKDNHHLVFDYNRNIDVPHENMILTFGDGTQYALVIKDYRPQGNILWSGTITAGGSPQVLQITTNVLNGPGAQFNIWRDPRYNNQSLAISITGDGTGDLARFSADGSSVSYTSSYVANFTSQ